MAWGIRLAWITMTNKATEDVKTSERNQIGGDVGDLFKSADYNESDEYGDNYAKRMRGP